MYLSKKAVLEWLKKQKLSPYHHDERSMGYSHVMREIQSGRFDAPEMEHINAYWAREGLIKHQEAEVQRLRAALEKARTYIFNGYDLGYIDDREGCTKPLLRQIDEALSTTEPTGAEGGGNE